MRAKRNGWIIARRAALSNSGRDDQRLRQIRLRRRCRRPTSEILVYRRTRNTPSLLWFSADKPSRSFASRHVDKRDRACCKETALVVGRRCRIQHRKTWCVGSRHDPSGVGAQHLVVEAAADEEEPLLVRRSFTASLTHLSGGTPSVADEAVDGLLARPSGGSAGIETGDYYAAGAAREVSMRFSPSVMAASPSRSVCPIVPGPMSIGGLSSMATMSLPLR